MTDDHSRRDVSDASAAAHRAFEQLPLPLVSFLGEEHRFVAANAAYRAFVGRDDLIGKTLREAFPELAGQQIYQMFDRVYATGRPESAHEWGIHANLSGTPTEVYLDFALSASRAEDGSVVGVHGYGVPATERVRQRRAEQASAAEAERRYAQAQDVVGALQAALLPAGLPVLAGVELAGRYVVAEADRAAGGDWFDAIPLGADRVALVVGDVVGHGVAASATMGQLRTVLADQLAGGAALEEAVARVQRYVERHPPARSATACVAVLDPGTGKLSYLTCGHPAPLVVNADGATRFLPPSGGVPLGTGRAGAPVQAMLAPGELVLLYTDGLVERPGQPMSVGQRELAQVAGDATADRVFRARPPEPMCRRMCAQTVELLARRAEIHDDVTVLAARLRPTPVEGFEQEMPARAGLLGLLRQRLDAWLTELVVAPEDLFAVQIAVLEAVTNVVEHAYPNAEPGPARVCARLDGQGTLSVRVSDEGRWRQPPLEPGWRGRGLVLIRQCMPSVQLTFGRSSGGRRGTEVLMRRPLRTQVIVEPAGPGHGARRDPVDEFDCQVHPGRPVRVVVSGPVDMTTAPRLRSMLREASRGGALPLVIDLDRVNHLSSSGVALLADMARAQSGRPRLVASPGTIARHVLALTGLDRHLID
jgi:anti-anti-sigma factor